MRLFPTSGPSATRLNRDGGLRRNNSSITMPPVAGGMPDFRPKEIIIIPGDFFAPSLNCSLASLSFPSKWNDLELRFASGNEISVYLVLGFGHVRGKGRRRKIEPDREAKRKYKARLARRSQVTNEGCSRSNESLGWRQGTRRRRTADELRAKRRKRRATPDKANFRVKIISPALCGLQSATTLWDTI